MNKLIPVSSTGASAAQFNIPASLGNIDAYIQTAHRYPILSEAEEFTLARDFQQSGDLASARQLVLSHLRLVISVSRGYLSYGLPQADLIQEGNVGLMKAVKRFDPERGVRLVSFALHWIRAEIHEYIIKNWRLVKIATTKAQRKLFFNLRSLKAALSTHDHLKPAEAQQIAQELGVKTEDVYEMEMRFSGHDISLENDNADDDNYAPVPIDYLSDSRDEPTQRIADKSNEMLCTQALSQALASLDDRSQNIVKARWLNENAQSTLHELAERYSVSAERIRQIESSALKKLRTLLAPSVAA